MYIPLNMDSWLHLVRSIQNINQINVLWCLIRYSSSLTLHAHVKTCVLSPAFCVELLNISRVINFYLQFWRVCACIFLKNVCACMNTHFTSTLKTTRVYSHARDTSRVYFVIHLTCTLDIGTHGRRQKLAMH